VGGLSSTIFSIPKMDCPSEEQLIRMALAPLKEAERLSFDLPKRQVTVIHRGKPEGVLRLLTPLGFDAKIVSCSSADSLETSTGDEEEIIAQAETSALKFVFAVNAVMFLVEIVTGWIAQSTGLIADSLDMFADAAVFAMSLYAVGRAVGVRRRAAFVSGILQLLLALGALAEVLRRFIEGSEPRSSLMIGIASLALIANAACMRTLARHRKGGVHMQASWIFLSNDVIANAGVIFAGILVLITNSQIPDLAVGTAITVVVLFFFFCILRLCRA